MLRLLFFILCIWISQSNAISPEKCVNKNQMCDLHGNNLIQSETGVTMPECQQLCEDTTGCNLFTYFGSNSFPYREVCMLFISCDSLDECEDCLTVKLSEFCTCGISYEGSVDSDNLLQIEEDVKNEQNCQILCFLNSDCSVYTYYEDSHVTNVKLCMLLTALQNPVRICENCQTGSEICENLKECKVGVVDTGDEVSITLTTLVTESRIINYISGEDGCYKTANAVAVGSGANGGECNDNYGGGGGSGFINTNEIVFPASTNISIEISGEGTFLKRQDTEEILLGAPNGTPPTECRYGGDGYSGGGGAGYSKPGGDGGSDGQDGVAGGYSAGKGSGFDIRSIAMKYYTFSVGQGGKAQGHYGGGGGGLLVDGSGPENGYIAGVGEGYGGGGVNGADSGSSGCVIVEL